MTEKIKLAALAHSKLRNAIGFVGVEIDPIKQEIAIKLAKHWSRDEINQIPTDVAEMFEKYQWSNTIIDLAVGSHLIDGLKRAAVPIKVIYIKKKVTDVSEIRRVKSLDLIEMVQYLLGLKLDHKLKFPRFPSKTMKVMEGQIAIYAEHTTEQGSVNYYAPGEEMDDLTKGLITVVFAARPYMSDAGKIVGGPIKKKLPLTFNDLAAIEEKSYMPKRRRRGLQVGF